MERRSLAASRKVLVDDIFGEEVEKGMLEEMVGGVVAWSVLRREGVPLYPPRCKALWAIGKALLSDNAIWSR
jgi:hypothetical protein